MQLHVVAAALLSLSASVFAQTSQSFNTTLTYDPVYDNANLSTTGIACSNGNNGVICKSLSSPLSMSCSTLILCARTMSMLGTHIDHICCGGKL